ncbi:MAG TPA: hypothetical protein PLV59_03700 [Candidatus Dojkabacteria bacterium]|nr:hypothetical protein [Candidatus Dojkabacteria bacterium]
MKKYILLTITILTVILSPISQTFAATQNEINTTLTTLEDERRAKLEKELGLTIPQISDNPNHIITFRDPSKEGVGVKLEIDGQGFKKVSSPYTLPSLGIGKHILTFKFTDSEETEQTLEETITIIPRPAIIDAPEKITTTELSFKGTALAASIVDLYLSSGTKHYKAAPDVNNDGSWSYTFKGEFEYGIYNIVAVTRKNGYTSNFSETIVFELTKEGAGSNNNSNSVKPISFSFDSLLKSDPMTTIKNNLDLLYLTLGSLLTGIILTAIFTKIADGKQHKNLEGVFLKKYAQKTEKPSKEEKKESKPMTLREKFEQAGLAKEEKSVEKKDEEKKEEEKKDEKKESKKEEKEKKDEKKTLSKEEFLEEFKEQDPDNERGKEPAKEEEKKKEKPSSLMNSIKISLTSKPSKK